ncbi:hypothetical protein [Saccharothrix longispora]|uniref:hypothetical protein n=1 Tax=Saccharothrix longispora TaxID=33920 RepID=UPI0028FD7A72|nr:hypothetical protein [Saccharothrix longispora]MDU0293036.1 hypothetical protein [Saccharothrix longispora]
MTSRAHRVEATAPAHPQRRGANEVAEWYRFRLGWPVETTDSGVDLTLTGGLVAFEVPAHLAGGVLKRLTELGAVGPALRTGVGNDRVTFLCDVNDIVISQADVPLGVRYLRVGTVLPLPSPRPSVAWFVAPDPDRGWLPSASAVLHAVWRTTTAAARVMSSGFPVRHVGQARPRRGFA